MLSGVQAGSCPNSSRQLVLRQQPGLQVICSQWHCESGNRRCLNTKSVLPGPAVQAVLLPSSSIQQLSRQQPLQLKLLSVRCQKSGTNRTAVKSHTGNGSPADDAAGSSTSQQGSPNSSNGSSSSDSLQRSSNGSGGNGSGNGYKGGGGAGGNGGSRLTGSLPEDSGSSNWASNLMGFLSIKEQQQGVVILLTATVLASTLSMALQLAISKRFTRTLEQGESQVEAAIDSNTIRDNISALKRLLREVFTEHLGFKARLDILEKAAAAPQLEAADNYQLQLAGDGSSSSSGNSWVRAPVRFSGLFSAAGILPWSQESSRAEVLAMLCGLGATGQADGRLQLHSVLAGGKRRVTAELRQELVDGVPMLQLQRLLYRVRVKDFLQLMIAPLGGNLDAIGRSITPIQADYGCTHTLRRGHGLSMFDSTGSGKAACLSKGRLSASAGFFMGGAAKTSLAQLQLKGQDGHSLSLVAARRRPRQKCSSDDGGIISSSSTPGMRFLGVQAPGCSSSSGGSSLDAPSSVFGAVGVVPIGDALTATAWAEQPSAGQPGWGLGLYSQPDRQGVELGMVLGKPSQHAAFRKSRPPVFCELSAKVPVGDGLSLSPGALLTVRDSKTTLAYVMQSSWRF